MTKKVLTFIAVAGILSFASLANADFSLTDANSMVNVVTTSQAGMNQWTVNGKSMLYQQWFWYRVGGSGPEASIDTLTKTSEVAAGRLGEVLYTGDGFTVDVAYLLTGGTDGTSDIAESIRIVNNRTTALDMHFFQYSDFDLGGAGNDIVYFKNVNSVVQSNNNVALSETVVAPQASHREAGYYPATLNRLNDNSATTLNDTPLGTVLGPGDMTWAYQWDVTIAGNGGTFIISKDKHISPVPVPAAIMLGVVGVGLVSWIKRRIS